MQKVIWKFEFKDLYEQSVLLPKRAEILGMAQQTNDLPTFAFWAAVYPNEEKEKRTIIMADTGDNISELDPSEWTFLGTICISNGNLRRHVFIKYKPFPPLVVSD